MLITPWQNLHYSIIKLQQSCSLLAQNVHSMHTRGPYMGHRSSKGVWEKSVVEKGVILTDISSQDIFYLFLLESSFDYKLVVTIYWATNLKEKVIRYLICRRCQVLKQVRNRKQDNDAFFKIKSKPELLWGKKCKILKTLENLQEVLPKHNSLQ